MGAFGAGGEDVGGREHETFLDAGGDEEDAYVRGWVGISLAFLDFALRYYKECVIKT